MSDIVERLRLRPQREMLYLDGCIAAGYGPTVESQAADEIERLRTRQSCEGDQPYICHALATARSRLAEAVKDNERLHAVAGRLIAVIRNVHGHLLDDRIDAALLGATDSATHREGGSHG